MYFEIYKDRRGEFRWRGKGNNHEIIASGEAYDSKSGVENVIDVLKEGAADAPIKDKTEDAPTDDDKG